MPVFKKPRRTSLRSAHRSSFTRRRAFSRNGVLVLCALVLQLACRSGKPVIKANYGTKTIELINIVEQHPDIKSMLVTSIEKAKAINPDRKSNPAQTLEEYYDFIAYAE